MCGSACLLLQLHSLCDKICGLGIGGIGHQPAGLANKFFGPLQLAQQAAGIGNLRMCRRCDQEREQHAERDEHQDEIIRGFHHTISLSREPLRPY